MGYSGQPIARSLSPPLNRNLHNFSQLPVQHGSPNANRFGFWSGSSDSYSNRQRNQQHSGYSFSSQSSQQKQRQFSSKQQKFRQNNHSQQQFQHISSNSMMKVHDALPKEALQAWERLKAKTERSIRRTQAG